MTLHNVVDAVVHRTSNAYKAEVDSALEECRTRAEAAEIRAQGAEERLSSVLDRSSDGVYEFDCDWRVIYMNEPARNALGGTYSPKGAIYWEVFPILVGTVFERECRRSCSENRPVETEFYCPIVSKWFLARIFPSAQGATIFFQNIDVRKRAEAELREAKEAAERASLAKSRFLAAASHDLRQPIQSLFFLADSLRRHVQDDQGQDKLSHLERGMDTLKQLLERLLDASRLDIGEVKASLDDFPVYLVFEHLKTIFGSVAAVRGLKLDTVPNDIVVRSDPLLLSRILRNLVENAIRYTQAGGIRVAAERTEQGVRLSVEDTGIGIPENMMERIWEEFYQLANPERDRQQGLGLGLPIVRRMAELLGHEIEVHSEVGVGSTFVVKVPEASNRPHGEEAGQNPAELDESFSYSNGMGRLVMVLDDDAMVLMTLKVMLEDWGYDVLVAGCEQQALDALQNRTRDPDVVIADYRLRDGKIGTDAVLQIREVLGWKVPAFLLTGEVAVEGRHNALADGLKFLQKPVTPRFLRAVLEKAIQSGEVSYPSGLHKLRAATHDSTGDGFSARLLPSDPETASSGTSTRH